MFSIKYHQIDQLTHIIIFYFNFIKMEDNYIVTFFSKQKQLHYDDFFQMPQLISIEQITNKFPHRLNRNEIEILNCLLYFIIFVEYKVKIQNYETIVRKSISQFYIKNHMQINLYQYGDISSKILSIQIHECIHIIYYILYGRFASASYVNLLVFKKQEGSLCVQKIMNSKSSKIDEIDQKSPKVIADKKISWKGRIRQSEIDVFAKNLSEVMKIRKPTLKIEAQPIQQKTIQDKNIVSYELKLSQIKTRQTSPIINLLKHKNEQLIQNLKPNKKILINKDTNFISKLTESKKQKGHIVVLEKIHKQGNRINLKTVYQMKQKIKNQNIFLDQLRTALTAQQDHSKSIRKKNQQKKLQSIDLLNFVNENIINNEIANESVINQKSAILNKEQIKQNPCEEFQMFRCEDQSDLKMNEDINFKFLSINSKTPYKHKVILYKKKFKEFLKSQQKRSVIFS